MFILQKITQNILELKIENDEPAIYYNGEIFNTQENKIKDIIYSYQNLIGEANNQGFNSINLHEDDFKYFEKNPEIANEVINYFEGQNFQFATSGFTGNEKLVGFICWNNLKNMARIKIIKDSNQRITS